MSQKMSNTDAKAFKFFTCLVCTVGLVMTGIYQYTQHQEAGFGCYQIVSDAAIAPGLHNIVKQVTADKKITRKECNQVIDAQDKLLKDTELLLTDINLSKK